jgi:hypothetical protein
LEPQTYKIRLPNGTTVDRELDLVEAEYFISVGMYIAHGFSLLTTVFAAEQMDEAANVELPEGETPVCN